MTDIAFAELIDRVQQGDEDAIQCLINEYGEAIRREIRFSLFDSRLRRKFGESDVYQSVLARFFVGLWAGKYDLECPEDLAGLLKTMVRSRIADLARFWTAKGRDIRQEVQAGSHLGRVPGDNEDTPSQIVARQELLVAAKQQLNQEQQQIIEWRQQRISWAEIANRLGGNSTPEAIRKRFERALTQIADDLQI